MSYAIRITLSNGKQSVHSLATAEISIGSDAASDICLGSEIGVLPNHALLAPRKESCWVSTAEGVAFQDGSGNAISGNFVPWGSRLTMGKCVFELLETDLEEGTFLHRNQCAGVDDKARESPEAKRARIHPAVLMLFIATLAYVAIHGLSNRRHSVRDSLSEAPALFAASLRSCQSANPGHRAAIAEEHALAKSERAVFDLGDGVEAVALFAEAESCYRRAGQSKLARDVATHAASFRRDLQEQYDLVRLRLSRDLAANDLQSANRQVARLTELLRNHADSEYSQALRRLSIRLSKKELAL